MFYSLRFGILMAMLAIAAVAIATVTVFVGLTTRAQFSEYVEAGRELRQDRIEQALVIWGDSNDTLAGIEVVGSIRFLSEDMQQVDPSNFRIRTVGTIGYLEEVGDSVGNDGETFRLELAPDGEMQVFQGQELVGTVFVDPIPEFELQIAEENFFNTINWTLLITAIVAGGAAIALTVILSRKILHPVAELTLAARRLEGGDFDQRVKVYATGEIGELAHAFNAMSEALKRNEDLRQNMVTDIAHELRTPLTNIRGYLEAMQDGVLEANRDTVDMLHEEAVMLNRLIQDLQELALAEAGALKIESQEMAVESLIDQTIVATLASAKAKNIRLASDLPNELPIVYADQRRVGQILRNLVNNAIIHTPPNGDVTVSAEIFPNEIEVRVSDTGDGIDAEHLPYLFERFYRADPSRSRATGGAGLGLAIVKNLVEAQGGHVGVESVKGKGATFSFTLPRQVMPSINPVRLSPVTA
ncbi:MAG: ATP-binding protein [Chloroflexota bacterium]